VPFHPDPIFLKGNSVKICTLTPFSCQDLHPDPIFSDPIFMSSHKFCDFKAARAASSYYEAAKLPYKMRQF
jgi:hypothetical protein